MIKKKDDKKRSNFEPINISNPERHTRSRLRRVRMNECMKVYSYTNIPRGTRWKHGPSEMKTSIHRTEVREKALRRTTKKIPNLPNPTWAKESPSTRTLVASS